MHPDKIRVARREVSLREITPLEKRNPQSGEVAGGNKAEPGTQIVLAVLTFSTLDGELQSEGFLRREADSIQPV